MSALYVLGNFFIGVGRMSGLSLGKHLNWEQPCSFGIMEGFSVDQQ